MYQNKHKHNRVNFNLIHLNYKKLLKIILRIIIIIWIISLYKQISYLEDDNSSLLIDNNELVLKLNNNTILKPSIKSTNVPKTIIPFEYVKRKITKDTIFIKQTKDTNTIIKDTI